MTLNTIQELKKQIEKIYAISIDDAQKETHSDEKRLKTAYAEGIAHALNIVELHAEQSSEIDNSSQIEQNETTQLHKMSAVEVFRINLETPEQFEKYSKEELAEAAFVFENEHMASLGDMNVIDYDTYTAMSPAELINIIKHSVQEICSINNSDL